MKTGLKMRESKTRAIISGIKKDWQLYVILLPIVIWFLLFAYKPMAGLIVAFKRYDATLGIAGSEFKGLSNFNNIVAGINKEAFWGAFRNTFIISAYGLVFGFPIPIILALLFSEIRSEGYRKITQTITYLPHFLSEVTITGIVITLVYTGKQSTGVIAQLFYNMNILPPTLPPVRFPAPCYGFLARTLVRWTPHREQIVRFFPPSRCRWPADAVSWEVFGSERTTSTWIKESRRYAPASITPTPQRVSPGSTPRIITLDYSSSSWAMTSSEAVQLE